MLSTIKTTQKLYYAYMIAKKIMKVDIKRASLNVTQNKRHKLEQKKKQAKNHLIKPLKMLISKCKRKKLKKEGFECLRRQRTLYSAYKKKIFKNLNIKKVINLRNLRKKNFLMNINKLDPYSIYHISNFLQRRKKKYPRRTRKSIIAKIKEAWDLQNIYDKVKRKIPSSVVRKKELVYDKSTKKRKKWYKKKQLLLNRRKKSYKRLRIKKKKIFLRYKKKIAIFFHNRLYSLYFY